MNEQLLLLRTSVGPHERPWRLDDRTREIGRRGLQEARAALLRTAADERGRTARPTAA